MYGPNLLPFILWCCAGARAYGECISVLPTHFSMGIFSFALCVGVSQLVSELQRKLLQGWSYIWCVYRRGEIQELTCIAVLVQKLTVLIVNV